MKFVNKNDGRELTAREYYSMVLREMEDAWYEQMDEDEKEEFSGSFVNFVEQDFADWTGMDTDFDCIEDD